MNSRVHTVELYGSQSMSEIPATGFWKEHPERLHTRTFDFTAEKEFFRRALSTTVQTTTAINVPWREEEQSREATTTVRTSSDRMLITSLGWSKEQALETRMRLRTFEEDWDSPGTESYDDL